MAVEPEPIEIDGFDPYEDAGGWSVSIYYPGALPNERDTEIARIDTSHGRPHFDVLFLSEKRKEWLPSGFELADAETVLTENWRSDAKRYDRNRGEAPEG